MAAPRTRRQRAPKTLDVPPSLPPTEREIAQQQELIRRLRELSQLAHQRNLDNAVELAKQAARGIGPLVDHFAELGRRFGHELLTNPRKPSLRVVKGGAA